MTKPTVSGHVISQKGRRPLIVLLGLVWRG